MIDFKYTSEREYLEELTRLLTTKSNQEDLYDDLMNEFMYFCEVSGSGR